MKTFLTTVTCKFTWTCLNCLLFYSQERTNFTLLSIILVTERNFVSSVRYTSCLLLIFVLKSQQIGESSRILSRKHASGRLSVCQSCTSGKNTCSICSKRIHRKFTCQQCNFSNIFIHNLSSIHSHVMAKMYHLTD